MVLVVVALRYRQLMECGGVPVRLLRSFLVLVHERPLLWLFVQCPLDILVHVGRLLQGIFQDLLGLVILAQS